MGFKAQSKKKQPALKTAGRDSGRSKTVRRAADEDFSADNVSAEKSPAKTKKKSSKASKIITSVLIVIAIGVFVFSLLQIITIMGEYKAGRDEYDRIAQDTVVSGDSGYLLVNYGNLMSINSDFKGWLDIPGTNVSYPIVHTAVDNDTYLHTTFEKKANSAGSIFVDCRSDPTFTQPVTVIYGHHMKDGSMFNNVVKFMDKAFWEEHKEVHIYTREGIMIYDVFSAYTASIEDECYVFGYIDQSAYNSWINNAVSKSNYNTGITPSVDSRSIILSTCVSGGPETEDSRHVLIATLREIIDNPTV